MNDRSEELHDQRALLERRIERDEEELARATRELRRRVNERARLGPRISDEPYRWMAGAFALGLWLGWREP